MSVKRFLIAASIALLIGCGGSGGGDDPDPPKPPPPPPPPPPPVALRVCLEWDAVIHPELVGYKIYYGKVSNQYDFNVEVAAPNTGVCIEDESYFVEGGDYYFVATAVSDVEESDYCGRRNERVKS
jgi:hypothetical protein